MSAGAPHWAARWVGQAWDPAEHHCWAFCRAVWAAEFGWQVPEMPISADDLRSVMRAFRDHPEHAGWQQVDEPRDGDAVLMARGARICHIGVWVAPDMVLHAMAGGALCTPARRIGEAGYRIVGTWRRIAP